MKTIKLIQEQFFIIHMLLVLLVYLTTELINTPQQLQFSIMVSAFFIGCYFSVFIWTMKAMVKTGSMGLVVFTLLTKFLVISAFIMYCVTNESFSLIGLIIGLSTAIPSIIIWSLINKKGIKIGTF